MKKVTTMNKTIYKSGLAIALLIAAQTPAFAAGEWLMDTLNDNYFWLVSMGIVFLLIALFAVNHAFNTIKRQFKPEADEAPEVSATSGLMQALTDATPVEKEADILLDHDYDGIKELDNNLPPWWKWGFYISIVYAVVYLFLFHVIKVVPLSEEEYNLEVAQAEIDVAAYLATAADLIDENSVTLLTDDARLASGKKIYDLNCVACHAADGGGLVGPNLTDPYWIHGGSINAVFKVIKEGVIEKGMIPWKTQLSPSQIQDVASYVLSLQGNKPANPKAAEGELYTPEPVEEVAEDEESAAEDEAAEDENAVDSNATESED
jgi:cytochrome c oxidase cbb3-type subunit III